MNNVFWIGVYPGLSSAMLEFVATTIKEFISKALERSNSESVQRPVILQG
jgi:hypothetical protein